VRKLPKLSKPIIVGDEVYATGPFARGLLPPLRPKKKSAPVVATALYLIPGERSSPGKRGPRPATAGRPEQTEPAKDSILYGKVFLSVPPWAVKLSKP